MNETCERIRELLAAYVLGVLDGEERAKVERHLERCSACRELAREHEEAVHALPSALAAASPVDLPRPLKHRVLQQIGDGREITRRGPMRRGLRWWRPRVALALAMVAVAALFVTLDSRLEDARSQERELRARIAKFEGLQPTVLEVLDSRHTVKRVLLPPEERSESRAYGKVFTRSDLPDVIAMANRLPPPAAGQAYQLWTTTAGRTRLVGAMPVDRRGFALLIFRADRANPTYEDVRILLQPRGARQPNGVLVLAWSARS